MRAIEEVVAELKERLPATEAELSRRMAEAIASAGVVVAKHERELRLWEQRVERLRTLDRITTDLRAAVAACEEAGDLAAMLGAPDVAGIDGQPDWDLEFVEIEVLPPN